MDTNYLAHYGIKRRSGRYPFGSGERPYQSIKQRRTPEAKAERINRRAEKKMSKIDYKTTKKQGRANKYFAKAQRKQVSPFATQRGVNKAANRAVDAQRKVNRLEYKGQKYYKKVVSKLNKIDREISPEVERLGQKYVKSVMDNSKLIYSSIITTNRSR